MKRNMKISNKKSVFYIITAWLLPGVPLKVRHWSSSSHPWYIK